MLGNCPNLIKDSLYVIAGGGGSGLDYVILLSEGGEGWVLITVDYGGGKGV